MSPPRSRNRSNLRALTLEERWLPSQTPIGPLLRPYTFSEVMASIRSDDPLTELGRWAAGDATLAADIDPSGSRVILNNNGAALVEVRLRDSADPLVVIDRLLTRIDVEWAEPNHIYVGDPRDFIPNDASYSSQYHHPLMQNDKAWDVQTGNPAIVLAILDDGMAINHPDLAPNRWVNSNEIANGIDDDSNGFIDDLVGWDIASNDTDPNPLSADTHGTHVSGIAAARTNNTVGVAGVAGGGPNGDGIRLMPVRWYGSGSWTASVIAQSYTYAANNGAKITNASYNFDGWSPGGVPDATVWNGLEYAYNKGLLIFQSAGNNGELDPDRGVFDQALFIASTTSTDARSSFSNYGQFVDVSSPGSSIFSTTTSTGGTVFTYGSLSGTSMSTPDAAAVAALIWSQHPTWTRDQVAAQLVGTADNIDLANPNNIDQLGTGRTNSFRGVTELLPPPKFGALSGLPAANETVSWLPTSFTLRAPMKFDPASVTASRFELRGDGADNMFDTGDDLVIPLTVNNGAIYRIGVGMFTFVPMPIGSVPQDRYRFKASAGITDPFGQALDGNGNGVGGDHLSRIFFIGRQIDGVIYEDRNADGVRAVSEPSLSGRMIYVDQDNDGLFDTSTTTYAATDLPLNILDFQATTSVITVNGFTSSVTDVNVKLSLTHTFDGDLSAYLIGPTGAKVELFSGVGGSGMNFTNTILDDGASTSIASGAAPFTGAFRPEGTLATFNGLDANGPWSLQVVDNFTGDTGTLDNWSIDLVTSEPFAISDANGSFTINGLANGSYSLRQLLPSGWNAGPGPVFGSYPITVTESTDQFLNRDFGELRANAIYGRFYDDVNRSGTFTPGEAPLAGWTAHLDGNNNGLVDSKQVTIASTNVPLALPDLTTTTSTISVNGTLGPVTDINVKLSINHATDTNLDVFLVGPTGKSVMLFTDVGGNGDNFTNTVLDDQAATAITAGTAPFTGTFRPEGKLSDFNGLAADGTWTLQIFDDTANTTGILVSWSLILSTAEATNISAADGSYSLINLPSGTYTLRRVLQGGYTPTQPVVGTYAVTLASGETISNHDFGQTKAPPPAKITQLKIDDGTAQRSLVRSLEVTFNQGVTLPFNPADAFQLKRQPDDAVVALNANLVGNTVTMTFTGGPVDFMSLADGLYVLTAFASAINGGSFDGNGDGVGGDDYVIVGDTTNKLFRLFGDSDGNATVNSNDFAAFRTFFGLGTSNFDFDNNSLTNSDDFSEFRKRFGITLVP